MSEQIFQISYLVDDYDRAIAYFTGVLGFKLLEDTKLSEEKRWVVIAPSGGGFSLLLAKASNLAQEQAIGNQFGGRVGFFMRTENFDETYAYYKDNGVEFTEDPRQEAYGKVIVFKDIYGQKWDLIERHAI